MRAVLVESYERIHRSNLVGMGVLPLQFLPGETAATYDLDGTEMFSITGLDRSTAARPCRRHRARDARRAGTSLNFDARLRIDTPTEAEYFRHGGVLNYVLRHLAST